MIKKLITLLMALVLVICMGSIAYAEDPCEHASMRELGRFAATCEDDGVITYICDDCGEYTETETLYATGHDFVWKNTKGVTPVSEATCVKGSVYYYSCWDCEVYGEGLGADIFELNDKKTEHSYGDWETVDEPKCGVAGTKTLKCTVEGCQAHIDEAIPPLKHSWDDGVVTKAATCTAEGEKLYTCQNGCGLTTTETIKIDADAHKLADMSGKAATCTDRGWEAYKRCSLCGWNNLEEDALYIAATGHTAADVWTVETEVKCDADGTEVILCVDCGIVLDRRTVTKTGHSWSEYTVIDEATCTEDGKKSKTCSGCNWTVEEAISATGHKSSSIWEVATEPVCGVPGLEVRYCINDCGTVMDKRDIPMLKHVWEEEGEVTKDPSCTEEGVLTYDCLNGCDVKKTEAIPMGDHNREDEVVDTEPTCNSVGYKKLYCSGCGEYQTRVEIPTLDHTPGEFGTERAPECKTGTAGLSVQRCTECGEVLDTEEIPAEHIAGEYATESEPDCGTETNGKSVQRCTTCGEILDVKDIEWKHNTEVVPAKEVTCTENGYKSYNKCTECDWNDYVRETHLIRSTGHTYTDAPENWVEVEPAKCGVAGLTELYCEVCGDVVDSAEIPALKHDKTAEYVVVTPATCTEAGWEEQYCARGCGVRTDERAIEALGHTFDASVEENWVIEAEATCGEDGLKRLFCEVCGTQISERTIPATEEHNRDDEVVDTEATCYSVGYKKLYCSGCGEYQTRVEIPMLEHAWDEGFVGKEPTCSEQGVITYTCTVEGCVNAAGNQTAKSEFLPIEEDAHSFTKKKVNGITPEATATCKNGTTYYYSCEYCDLYGKDYGAETFELNDKGHVAGEPAVTEATCVGWGYEDLRCTECGRLMYRNYTARPLGHDMQPVSGQEPTCEEDGYVDYLECANGCGEQSGYEVIPSEGHDFTNERTDDQYLLSPATCTSPAIYVYSCMNCDAQASDDDTFTVGEALPHEYTSVTTDATCTVDGKIVYTCECGDTYTETITAPGHVAGKYEETKAPTCTEYGERTKSCTVCGAVIKVRADIEPLGHSYEAVTTDATCSAEGKTVYTCSECGDTYTETIAKIAHTPVEVKAVKATCTATGLTAGEKCSVCGEILKAQEEVAKLAHSIVKVGGKAPTCTEIGYTEADICEMCLTVVSAEKVMPAIDHDWDEGVVTTEATCEAEGVMTYTCANDAKHTKTEAIAKAEHTKGEWVPEKEATCTEAGLEIRVCAVCGVEIASQEIPALGHTTEGMEWNTEVAPTCTEAGKAALRCAVCNEVVEVKDVEATGHTYVVTETDATCTEAGTIVYTCACGDTYTETVEAKGHNLQTVEAKANSCLEDGHEEYKACTECDYTTEIKVIKAHGHETTGNAVGVDIDMDEHNHWWICDYCNEVTKTESHNFTNVWEASKTETWYGCGCGYVLIVKE